MNKDEIMHLARLARIELTPAEIEAFPAQCAAIVDFISQIHDADIDSGVVRDMTNSNSFRTDTDTDMSQSRDAIIKNFPASKGDLLQVSSILPTT